jgi:hypothetical protein
VLPCEFLVGGTPVSVQTRRRSRLDAWRTRVRNAAQGTSAPRPILPTPAPTSRGPTPTAATFRTSTLADPWSTRTRRPAPRTTSRTAVGFGQDAEPRLFQRASLNRSRRHPASGIATNSRTGQIPVKQCPRLHHGRGNPARRSAAALSGGCQTRCLPIDGAIGRESVHENNWPTRADIFVRDCDSMRLKSGHRPSHACCADISSLSP